MLETLLTVAGTLVSSGLLFFIGFKTYRNTRKKDREQAVISKEANAITFNADLLKEVRDLRSDLTALDDKITKLRDDLNAVTELFRAAINFAERVMLAALRGAPMPSVPLALRKYFDPALLDEHERQQANPKA